MPRHYFPSADYDRWKTTEPDYLQGERPEEEPDDNGCPYCEDDNGHQPWCKLYRPGDGDADFCDACGESFFARCGCSRRDR